MDVLRRGMGAVATVGVAAGLLLGTSGAAYAGTAVGKSCGEKHPVSPEYYDGAGNAAPCTADFTAAGSGTARITVDVIQHSGVNRNDPRRWSFDLACSGTVLPSDPPRTFACRFGPGAHTVYVDKTVGDDLVDLRVTY